jgi:hypothetical protein
MVKIGPFLLILLLTLPPFFGGDPPKVKFNQDSVEVYNKLKAQGNFQNAMVESTEKTIGSVVRTFLNLHARILPQIRRSMLKKAVKH